MGLVLAFLFGLVYLIGIPLTAAILYEAETRYFVFKSLIWPYYLIKYLRS